ncbi:P-type conjugative transfer ATPase TrbB [Salmonella enterica]|uniref:P-type conjugative transfer ATPase TrbB n=2 Tax=Gammaproteobacteria TaxID=1236 RepID=UPI0007994DB1|nr:P-type conjugative transfer ATPase TrbB [Enterobacter hormaechei]EAO5102692.1 P-type conjugative transfer ATPase TrbB [Salmonella enterica]ECM3357641.1 P-type conjugative transfer ATPase TrbB [Salmonella enterica subsp. enterica serovar Enteritidis]ECN4650348.1 P-type conjugative transfer ATPase TrbB [Salmonella enterica subsp. enterica serovar Kentucky]EIY9820497.1 P-type conjugative transfer ATPase TrbB [Escherichia coli]EAV7022681.1 P-type conjugative transfer ATPase TrbB [Salmonella ent
MDENSPERKATSLQSNRAEHDRRIAEKLRRELGPQVCALLDDTKVIEIMLNPDGSLWCEWLGQPMERVGTMPKAQAESLMGTVASSLRTHITAANPILECELPLDGSRFEALLPPIVSGPTFTIRKKASIVFTLANYVKSGIMTEAQCEAIKWAVRERKNILVVGGTGTGKTTLTNAIIAEIDAVTPEHRIVIIEDTRELQCSSPNVVPLRAVDHVDMTRLLKATMRLRPDRILVGEARDGSALALLKAWNTGHPGGAATVHANSANAGLIRMEQLVAEATAAPMQALIAEAIDLIIAIEKTATGRRIKEVVTVSGHDGTNYITQPV